MKLNRLLLLAFLTIAAGGCATNYHHGPENYGSPNNLPPGLWGNALHGGETNGRVSPATAYVMRGRET